MTHFPVLAALLLTLSALQEDFASDQPKALIFIDLGGLRGTEVGQAILQEAELQLLSDTYNDFKAETGIEPIRDISSVSYVVYAEDERIITIRGRWERDLLRRYLESEFEPSTLPDNGNLIYTLEGDGLTVALPEDGLAYLGDEYTVPDALRGRYAPDIRLAESSQGDHFWMMEFWSSDQPVTRSMRITDPSLVELRASCSSCDPTDSQALYETGTDEILRDVFPFLFRQLPDRLEQAAQGLKIQTALEQGFAVVRIELPADRW